jgi:glycosyltransferase involved in cell wall biosynthesis
MTKRHNAIPRVDKERLAVFVATSGHSGVDRVMRSLLPSIASRGVKVDLLKVRNHGPEIVSRHRNLRILDLGTSHSGSSLVPLIRYLRESRPAVLLSDKDRVNQVAILARAAAGVPTRNIVRIGTTVSINLRARKPFNRAITYLSMRYLYRRADKIILPSTGAVDDFLAVTKQPPDRVVAVPSPVLTPELLEKADKQPEHPWLREKQVPVVVGIGELSGRKNYSLLIRAFALVRKHRQVRLIIFGEGRKRPALESLIREMNLSADVHLPGFTSNPYSELARADLYVHASRFEGSPVALMEAVSLGIPSVSTDCPSGPREILGDGQFGLLVKIDDPEEMAGAMIRLLDEPPDPGHVRLASQPFSIERSTDAYMKAMGFMG